MSKKLEQPFIVPTGRVFVQGRPAPYLQGQKIPQGSTVTESSDKAVAKLLGLVKEPTPKTIKDVGGESK